LSFSSAYQVIFNNGVKQAVALGLGTKLGELQSKLPKQTREKPDE